MAGKGVVHSSEFVEGTDGLTHLSRDFVRDASPDEIVALFRQDGEVETAADVLGDGVVVPPKDDLIDTAFFLFDWSFKTDGNGAYVLALGLLEDGTRIAIKDYSTGIRRQLMELTEARRELGRKQVVGGLLCKDGLRVSHYQTELDDGSKRDATTYYIA